MQISQELSDNIQKAIDQYVSINEPILIRYDGEVDLRKIAKELNVLPLVGDFGHNWGLNIQGEVVCFPYNNLNELEIIDDEPLHFQGMRRRVYLLASTEHGLEELLPERSADSIDCSDCKGTGRNPINDTLGYKKARIGCKCFGLGWLPKYENDFMFGGK